MMIAVENGLADRADRACVAAESAFGATERHRSDRSRLLSAGSPVLQVHTARLSLWVFGTLICENRPALELSLQRAGSAIEASESLVGQAWGSYVAYLECDGQSYALRDPSGAVPLFVLMAPPLRIASTRLTPAFLRGAGVIWQLNEHAVATLLVTPPAPAYCPGLVDIEIVVPGQLVGLTQSPKQYTVWSPAEIATASVPLEPEELTSTVDEVLGSLTGRANVGVELSGGIDSSIVFSSLSHLGHRPKPFNFATTGKGGDETRFATDVAERWDSKLRLASGSGSYPDYGAFEAIEHGVQPVLHGLDSLFAQARQDHIDKEQLDLVMTGQGGDAVFFNLPTRLVAVDRYRDLGLGSLFGSAIADDARRVRGSVWEVFATVCGRRLGADRADHEWLPSNMLGEEAIKHLAARPPEHPWLMGARNLAPGKALHLLALSICQIFHGGRLFSPSVPTIHPLLTQPLIELSLRCPTYLLQFGPRDRGLAREAFGSRLPQSVLLRRNKGEASDHYARAILSNRDWLMEYIGRGKLAASGFVNGEAIELALAPDAIRLGTDYRSFVQYAAIESWFRYWS